MSESVATLLDKTRKVARYARLYGPGRTLAKVQAEVHATRRFAKLPPTRRGRSSPRHVAFIGCGKFAFSTLAYYLRKHYGNVIRAAMDIDIHRAASLFEAYDADYYGDDAEEIFGDPAIDLVFIASNHSSHTSYAVRALEAGKSVHIEKPHVTSFAQLEAICRAMRASPGRVNLGFNRPNSPFAGKVRTALAGQNGSILFNWFVVGHEIGADHWYNREEEGGRVFGNLCHWTDFVYQMVPPSRRYPITLRATQGTESETDIALTLSFGDGSLAVISFCAKGAVFEGVRERLSLQRRDLVIALDDFDRLVIEQGSKKRHWTPTFRDHGHEATVMRSYQLVRSVDDASAAAYLVEDVWQTAEIFLRAKESLNRGTAVELQPFDRSRS